MHKVTLRRTQCQHKHHHMLRPWLMALHICACAECALTAEDSQQHAGMDCVARMLSGTWLCTAAISRYQVRVCVCDLPSLVSCAAAGA